MCLLITSYIIFFNDILNHPESLLGSLPNHFMTFSLFLNLVKDLTIKRYQFVTVICNPFSRELFENPLIDATIYYFKFENFAFSQSRKLNFNPKIFLIIDFPKILLLLLNNVIFEFV